MAALLKHSSPNRRNKRSLAQKAADALIIEAMHLKGYGCQHIAEEISEMRPYSLSQAQVAFDLAKLHKQWEAEAKALINDEKIRILRKLDRLERELWDAWERSKRDDVVSCS